MSADAVHSHYAGKSFGLPPHEPLGQGTNILLVGKMGSGKSAFADSAQKILAAIPNDAQPRQSPADLGLLSSYTLRPECVRLTKTTSLLDVPGFKQYSLSAAMPELSQWLQAADGAIAVSHWKDWMNRGDDRAPLAMFWRKMVEILRQVFVRPVDMIVTHSGTAKSEAEKEQLRLYIASLGFGQVFLIECYTSYNQPPISSTDTQVLKALHRAQLSAEQLISDKQQQHVRPVLPPPRARVRSPDDNSTGSARKKARAAVQVHTLVGVAGATAGTGGGIATAAGVGMAIGSPLGPAGMAIGGLVGCAIGLSVGIFLGGRAAALVDSEGNATET